MGVNKITIDGVTKINLLNTDIETAADIPAGKYGYLKTGELVLGTGENMSSNPLNGKILAANGDSICHGTGNNDVGYPELIGTANGMTVQNIAVGGATIATGTAATHYICNTISDMRSDADYVLLEGGVNDADYHVTLGTLSDGYDDTLNTGTFAGAFEQMLKSALARFPGKKIGYIFTHKVNGAFDSQTTNSYYNVAKAACEKWGIPYCDLNTLCPPLGQIDALKNAYTNNGDGYHPNADGYNAYYVPKITAWMKTL